jgi:hypothetical protein
VADATSEYRADQYNFALMQNVAGWLSNYLTQQKQTSVDAKAADSFFKANPDALTKLNIHPDEYKNLSSTDRIAARVGYLQAQQAENVQAAADERRQVVEDDRTAGQFVNSFMTYPGREASPGVDTASLLSYGQGPIRQPDVPASTGNDFADRWAYASRNTPGLAARHVDRIVSSLSKWQQITEGGGESLSPAFVEDPNTGARFVTRGKTMLPSGVNPERAVPRVIPQHDDSGNLLGWSQVDSRGRAIFTPYKGNSRMTQATDEQGKPIDNFYFDSQGKAHDLRTLMQKAMGDTPTTTPAQASGKGRPPTITTEEQYKALGPNQEYYDAAGNLRRKKG